MKQKKCLSLLLWFGLSIVFVGRGDTVPAATLNNPQIQTNEQIQKPEGKRKGPLIRNKVNTKTPFALRSELGAFPSKPVESVRLFEGMSTFRQFTNQEKLTVRSIGDFKRRVAPDEEMKFRDVLIAHAAKCGADYVVIVTDSEEIERELHLLPMDEVTYCAVAYKRAEAHLGFIPDKGAVQDSNQIKIADFTPGSRAKEDGLRVGDVIQKVDGTPPAGGPYWGKALRWKVGDKVKVEIERGGKIMEFDVALTAG